MSGDTQTLPDPPTAVEAQAQEAASPSASSGGYSDPKFQIYVQETTGYAQEKLEIFKIIPTFMVSISTILFGGSVWALSSMKHPVQTWLLIGSWIGLAATMILMLLELLFSLRAYERAEEIATVRYRTNDYLTDHANRWTTACRWLQNSMVSFFVLGIVLFLLFFSFNLSAPRSNDGQAAGRQNPEEHTVPAPHTPDQPANPNASGGEHP